VLFRNLSALTMALVASASHAQTVFPDPAKPLVPLSMHCRQPGLVALTFDDGPTTNTTLVLQTLDTYDVKATFFILGAKLEFPTRVQQAQYAVSRGHQIENHSWDHPDFTTLTDAQLIDQIDRTNAIIWEQLGVKTRFVRPPKGRINVVQGIPIWDMGYGVSTWNLDPKDYIQTADWTADNVYQAVADTINASDPATDSYVILLHDASAASATRLGDMITTIQAKGYQLVTLNECADAGR
jgi:peptidoglycan/xylan/chitin deacetylase (PgdA/CDA1 family)